MFFEVISAAQKSEEKHLAFYDERNLFKKLKNPQGVFSREKSAKRFGVIRSLQLAETGPVALADFLSC